MIPATLLRKSTCALYPARATYKSGCPWPEWSDGNSIIGRGSCYIFPADKDHSAEVGRYGTQVTSISIQSSIP